MYTFNKSVHIKAEAFFDSSVKNNVPWNDAHCSAACLQPSLLMENMWNLFTDGGRAKSL